MTTDISNLDELINQGAIPKFKFRHSHIEDDGEHLSILYFNENPDYVKELHKKFPDKRFTIRDKMYEEKPYWRFWKKTPVQLVTDAVHLSELVKIKSFSIDKSIEKLIHSFEEYVGASAAPTFHLYRLLLCRKFCVEDNYGRAYKKFRVSYHFTGACEF